MISPRLQHNDSIVSCLIVETYEAQKGLARRLLSDSFERPMPVIKRAAGRVLSPNAL
jgi:hypothetical protein